MNKLIYPIAIALPLFLFSCGADSSEKNDQQPEGSTELANDTTEVEETQVNESEEEEVPVDNRLAKEKEAVYSYLFSKHVEPVEGGLHDYKLTFNDEEKTFDFSFTITQVEEAENLDGELVEQKITDRMQVVGSWMSADEDNGVAILVVKGDRTFTDSYLNMYGDLVSNKVEKGFNDEISVDYNQEADSDFFGSKMYKKVSTQKITEDDLEGLAKDEMAYLRNEIYARKGHIFKTDKMNNYFRSKPWYQPLNENAEALLTDLEKNNAKFIKSLE